MFGAVSPGIMYFGNHASAWGCAITPQQVHCKHDYRSGGDYCPEFHTAHTSSAHLSSSASDFSEEPKEARALLSLPLMQRTWTLALQYISAILFTIHFVMVERFAREPPVEVGDSGKATPMLQTSVSLPRRPLARGKIQDGLQAINS